MECYVCKETQKDGEENARSVEGAEIFVCNSCDYCDSCEEHIEDIDESNWVRAKRYSFPGGWLFLPPGELEKLVLEDDALRCNYCQSMHCDTCEGFCKKACIVCDSVCEAGCACKE